ncbi:MAG: HAD family acid phosphatase [Elusimicrobiota bacterium]
MRKLSNFKFIALVSIVFLLASGCNKTTETEKPKKTEQSASQLKVGFDVDDTLLFSTPAFQKGFQSDTQPFSDEFWKVVNTSDRGNSKVKEKAREIMEKYRSEGAEIFAVTARNPSGGQSLKDFLKDKLGIPRENTFFEPDSKVERLKKLNLDKFYGDSDSDIKDAMEAGVKPYRIQRSTASSYQEKYNPGKYGEEIIENSAW